MTGLRYGLDLHHQFGTDIEGAPVFIDVTPDHLAQVMTGGEHLASGCQNYRAEAPVSSNTLQTVDQFGHEFERLRVAAVRPSLMYDRQLSFVIEQMFSFCVVYPPIL